jgi:beta-glucosidase
VEHASGPEIRRTIPSFFDDIFPGPKTPPQTAEEGEAAFAQAVALARGTDAAVLVMGERANMSGEAASRGSLDLPWRQQPLLEAIVALGKPVVLVLMAGRPLSVSWAAEHVPAILMAWQPGTEGGHAVADVLFGDVNPGGKLPVTFPRSGGHSPLYYARNLTHQPESSFLYRSRYWEGPTTPLYPFGHGLSYTTFEFSNLRVESSPLPRGRASTVRVDVANTGPVAGDEVAQLYVHQRAGSDSRPRRELKGFQRIALAAGEKKTVRFKLGPEELGYWSTRHGRWVQDEATFDVWAGSDSTAKLQGELVVVASAAAKR